MIISNLAFCPSVVVLVRMLTTRIWQVLSDFFTDCWFISDLIRLVVFQNEKLLDY